MIQKDLARAAEASEELPPAFEVPLCVDLDGTLIRGDVTWESLLSLVAQSPFYALLIAVWLMKGRAHMKRQITKRVQFEAASLPYNQEFLTYLRSEVKNGRELILVTASDTGIAGDIADHLGIFSEVMASDGVENLKGDRKRATLVRRFGERGYDYAGNSHADISVWKDCRRAIVVNASAAVSHAAAAVSTVESTFPPRRAKLKTILKAIRAYQWEIGRAHV